MSTLFPASLTIVIAVCPAPGEYRETTGIYSSQTGGVLAFRVLTVTVVGKRTAGSSRAFKTTRTIDHDNHDDDDDDDILDNNDRLIQLHAVREVQASP